MLKSHESWPWASFFTTPLLGLMKTYCSPRLSNPKMKSVSVLLVMLLIMMMTEKAKASFDNTSITSQIDDKYLQNNRVKRGGGGGGHGGGKKEHTCDDSPNKNLCLPKSYSKFELPFTDSVNVVEIGIDIIDVLRINDKVRHTFFSRYMSRNA